MGKKSVRRWSAKRKQAVVLRLRGESLAGRRGNRPLTWGNLQVIILIITTQRC